MKAKNLLILSLSLIILSAGCKKKTNDPEISYFYASAQIKGATHSFKTTSNFSKFCIMTGVCNTFYTDPQSGNQNVVSIGLPVTVKAGVSYTSDSSYTQLMYIDPAGRKYFSRNGDSLNITVTKWEGHGGTGAGTFSGKLMFEGSTPYVPDSVYITNGSFSAKIWFVIQ